MAKELYVKDSGVWKETQELYVKDGGAWKEVSEGWTKDSGTWKQFFSSDSGENYSMKVGYFNDGSAGQLYGYWQSGNNGSTLTPTTFKGVVISSLQANNGGFLTVNTVSVYLVGDLPMDFFTGISYPEHSPTIALAADAAHGFVSNTGSTEWRWSPFVPTIPGLSQYLEDNYTQTIPVILHP